VEGQEEEEGEGEEGGGEEGGECKEEGSEGGGRVKEERLLVDLVEVERLEARRPETKE